MSDPMPQPAGVPALSPVPIFYIPATTSLHERRPRTLKHGDTFAVFDHNGDILQGPGSSFGHAPPVVVPSHFGRPSSAAAEFNAARR
jgi:hypothetical protein